MQEFRHSDTRHLEDVQFCCREALIILSPSAQEPTQRKQLLSFVLEPLVVSWRALSTKLLSMHTAEAFLGLILQHTSSSRTAAAATSDDSSTSSSSFVTELLSILESFYCLGKRVFVKESIASGHVDGIRSLAELALVSPFTIIWQELFPALVTLLQYLDGISNAELKEKIVRELGIASTDVLLGPSDVEIHRECGVSMKSLQPTGDFVDNMSESRSESIEQMSIAAATMYSIRRLVIQLLGLSTIHRALYFDAQHKTIMGYITASFASADNIHISQLSHRFLLLYVSNLPRSMFFDPHSRHYETASIVVPAFVNCMAVYLQEMVTRISIVIQDAIVLQEKLVSSGGPTSEFTRQVLKYKYCSMSSEMQSDLSMVGYTSAGVQRSFGSISASRVAKQEMSTTYRCDNIVTSMLRNFADVVGAMFDLGNAQKQHLQQSLQQQKSAEMSIIGSELPSMISQASEGGLLRSGQVYLVVYIL